MEEIHQALALLSDRLVMGILGALAVVVLAIRLRYQRCPHCRGFVVRAGEAWKHCPRCGRQYHRGLRTVR